MFDYHGEMSRNLKVKRIAMSKLLKTLEISMLVFYNFMNSK
jgi:hypothetical protein